MNDVSVSKILEERLSLQKSLSTFPRYISDNIVVIIFICLLLFASWGFYAFNNILADDEWQFTSDGLYQVKHNIQTGRWLRILPAYLLESMSLASSFTTIVFFSLLLVSILFTLHYLRINDRLQIFVASSVFCCFSVWAFTALFKSYLLIFGSSILLSFALALLLANLSLKRLQGNLDQSFYKLQIAAGILLVILILASYQSYLFFSIITLLMILVIHGREFEVSRSTVFSVAATLFMIFAIGSALYLVISGLLIRLFDAGSSTNPTYDMQFWKYIDLAAFKEMAFRFVKHIYTFLFEPQHLVPLAIKGVFLTTIIATAFNKFSSDGLMPALRHLLLMGMIITLPFTFGLIHPYFPYRYTSLAPLSLVYVAAFLFYIKSRGEKGAGKILLTLWLVSIVVFVNMNSAAANTLSLVNQRDMALTSRIFARVEQSDFYKKMQLRKRIAIEIIGEPSFIDGYPFSISITDGPMSTSEINKSIFRKPPRLVPEAIRLIQYDGIDYYWRRNKELGMDEITFVNSMPNWPEEGSVAYRKSVLYIKFSDIGQKR